MRIFYKKHCVWNAAEYLACRQTLSFF